jgi:hypothetical protein
MVPNTCCQNLISDLVQLPKRMESFPLPPLPLPPLSLPSPGLPPPADSSAPPTHSLTLVILPRPAATQPATLASASSPLSAQSVAALPGGRSKAQRWCEEDLPSAASRSDLRRSYKEALVDGRSTACGAALVDGRSTAYGADIGDGGWVKVVGRRSHHRSPCPPLPFRPVPVDLRGKCFNCFSPSHRAAECGSLVRCFHCRLPRHQVRACPHRKKTLHHLARVLVWHPVPRKVISEKVHLYNMEGVSRVSGDGDGVKTMKRTRRGQRRRRMDRVVLGALGRVSSLASSSLPSVVHPPRSHILRRSRLLDQAEEDLHHALIVNVLG